MCKNITMNNYTVYNHLIYWLLTISSNECWPSVRFVSHSSLSPLLTLKDRYIYIYIVSTNGKTQCGKSPRCSTTRSLCPQDHCKSGDKSRFIEMIIVRWNTLNRRFFLIISPTLLMNHDFIIDILLPILYDLGDFIYSISDSAAAPPSSGYLQ